MAVILHYDSGFATRLKGRKYLEKMLRQYGTPDRIDDAGVVWKVCKLGCWKEYRYTQSLDIWRDKRKIVRIELE